MATGTSPRTAAQNSAEGVDSTDFQRKLQDTSLSDVLVHGYLGIIFGEPGWPYPEVYIMVFINTDHYWAKTLSILPYQKKFGGCFW